MNKFGDSYKYLNEGGTKGMGDALRRGIVLVLSLWDDWSAHMKWLDGLYPPGSDPNSPGKERGPCSASSGDPNNLRSTHPNAYVTYTNFKVGTIGSTTFAANLDQNGQ